MNRGQSSWKRIAKGVNLTGFGVFLLLTTLGVLPWAFWGTLIAYWPILLITAGIYLVFDRSRTPWLVLLSPVVMLGTMTFVALRSPAAAFGSGYRVEAARPAEAASWQLEGDLAMAEVDLVGRDLAPGMLLEGEAAGSPTRPTVYVRGSDESPRVRLRNGSFHWAWPGRGPWGRVEAGIAPDLPLTLDLDLAFVEGKIDVGAIALTRATLDGAFDDLTLRLGRPESDVRLSLQGAFNRITIEVPADVPVSVDTDGFMNSVHGRDTDASRRGPGYELRLDGAFNWIDVRAE
jgi:cell wall-active antibiotic response 4TMS protein YvqF